ncbi:MAG: TolC family protein [Melioribacteraceae bacterium]|nr:MAG: TolC family protein [Melioribacteraceae bacterium]
MKHLSLSLFLISLFFVSFTNSYPQSSDAYLESLIKKAIEVSPKLKALKNKQGVADSKIAQNSNLPDPMLTLGLMNLPTNSFSFTQEPMTGKIIGLSQAVPFPGRLSAAADMLGKDGEIVQQEIDDSRNEIANDVRKIYYELRFTREAIRIAERSKKNLEQISQVVKTKYTVSNASQQNLIQIEVELTKIRDKIEELKGNEGANLAALNSYLLQAPDVNIQTEKVPAISSNDFTVVKLVESAKENRPFLKGISLATEKSKLMENLADYEFYPNFNFSVQYSQRDEISRTNTPLNDLTSFMVGINLPFDYGGKKSSKVEEAQLMQKMYIDQYDAALQMLSKSFGVSVAKLNELKERERLVREGLLPQAEQALKATIANYQVGEIDFINVLDAQNKVYEVETNLYKIRTAYFKELSQLEFLTGTKNVIPASF